LQRRFELETHEARRIIREHHDNPGDFRFTRTLWRRAEGTFFFVKAYTVVVSRGKVPAATYEGGSGKNWVVLFAHDLAMHRFSESTGGSKPDAS
jgi:hypothetical protein